LCAKLVMQALRMRRSRLVVGDVGVEECLDLPLPVNAGLAGMAILYGPIVRRW